MLQRDQADISAVAGNMESELNRRNLPAKVEVIHGFSQMGSGSLPGENLPTSLVAVSPHAMNPAMLARLLRLHTPAIFTRIHKDQVLIDPRTLLEGQDSIVVKGLVEILESGE
jgi:L-seryl-tRNA(Ser) seleniumtransferase